LRAKIEAVAAETRAIAAQNESLKSELSTSSELMAALRQDLDSVRARQ
jgi:hypothetical protein